MACKASKNPTTDLRERLYVPELLRGLAITTRHFLRNLFNARSTRTSRCRTGRAPTSSPRSATPRRRLPTRRGTADCTGWCRAEDGKPRCVACYMCATICPAQCIYIEAGEYETTDPSADNRVIEKYPTQFVIDELRCIVCGFCVDACPKDAIRMDTGLHTPSEYNRQGFIWDIPKLLQGPPVSHPSDPWNKRESSRPPPHQHLEPHTRIGEGLTPLKLPASGQEPHARDGGHRISRCR